MVVASSCEKVGTAPRDRVDHSVVMMFVLLLVCKLQDFAVAVMIRLDRTICPGGSAIFPSGPPAVAGKTGRGSLSSENETSVNRETHQHARRLP
ncbi:MAG: hypothetical protein CMJ69_08135 [Planctomycetaceae bacterium]|nr:hypothetical protein [Planctomycetaceae bacterium]